MDRWSIVSTFVPHDDEVNIVTAKMPEYADKKGAEQIGQMADLTRKGFMVGDLSTVMSPRTVITCRKTTYFW